MQQSRDCIKGGLNAGERKIKEVHGLTPMFPSEVRVVSFMEQWNQGQKKVGMVGWG